MTIHILGIESSCDDTSASVISDGVIQSNVIAGQWVHEKYGGVVPELASRAHQENIVPVVDVALKNAGISVNEISAIAFTRGPGLLGSLLVGASFAKGLSISHNIPLIDVNHLNGHILSHFIAEKDKPFNPPVFPHLCLLVSGGHTQIIIVKDYFDLEIIGQTIDDAAGEAFDKCAKVMSLPYPGGPVIDKFAKEGNAHRFTFAKPRIPGLNFSFSGLKTSFLYFLRDEIKKEPQFIENNINDLCASLQETIVQILMANLEKAVKQTGIKYITLSGGVSANSAIRKAVSEKGLKENWNVFLPELKYTTDNAAMIAITGYFKYKQGLFCDLSALPMADLDL